MSLMIKKKLRVLLPLSYLVLVTACDGSGSSGQPTVTPPPPPPPEPTSINLSSDPGDYVGGGQFWEGEFQLPDSYSQLEAGTYNNLTRYTFHDPAVGGLSWAGEGRGCNTLAGTMIINEVIYDGTTLTGIDLELEQYCENGSPALRGDIHWDADDATSPLGPEVPPPAGLWAPAAGITPASGNYVYLESDVGDWIGAGANYLYTVADSVIDVLTIDALLEANIAGYEHWDGEFQAMNSQTRLEVGFYGDLQRHSFHNPVKGSLSWSGEGRGCNTLTGDRSAIRTALRRRWARTPWGTSLESIVREKVSASTRT
jgi:hypothetical protein